MTYAIIAAGEGSRLTQEGISTPKPLVNVGGERLLDRLLRVFSENGATDITVICNDLTPLVAQHLEQIERNGLYGHHIPLRHLVETTPSSMHSFARLAPLLTAEPFVLTTVDTIFREQEFADYLACFSHAISQGQADGVMGVTDYIDDESPLYVSTTPSGKISAFLDSDPDSTCRFISGGIYGLTPKALDTLNRCMAEHQSRMRNFQRGLLADGLTLQAFPFSKVLDIDHASDIRKAEQFLSEDIAAHA